MDGNDCSRLVGGLVCSARLITWGYGTVFVAS